MQQFEGLRPRCDRNIAGRGILQRLFARPPRYGYGGEVEPNSCVGECDEVDESGFPEGHGGDGDEAVDGGLKIEWEGFFLFQIIVKKWLTL